MEKIILSARMQLIASLVMYGSIVADVGTDHGYIPTWLVSNGISECAVATDINEGPLARAKQVVKEYGVSDKVKLLLCDGLSAVEPHEVDTVVIAGMGGETIIGILLAAPWTKENVKLILQPQSKQPELRRWLCENGYEITGEHLVKDAGKVYSVLTVQGGYMAVPDTAQLYSGDPKLHSDAENFKEFLLRESAKLTDIADKLKNSGRIGDIQRRNEYLEAAEGMEKMLKEMDQ